MEVGQWIAIIITVIITITLLLNKRRIEKYFGTKWQDYIKNKIGDAEYNRLLNERIVFRQGEISFAEPDSYEKFECKEPVLYKTNINYGYVILFILFVILGIAGLYWNRDEEGLLNRYFTLIFSFFGGLLLIKYFTTKYIINRDSLDIYSGKKKYIIPYGKILEVEKRTINQAFRHGHVKGRLRAETNRDVLFIIFIDFNNKQQTIMISPVDRDLFIRHLKLMIRRQSSNY